MVLPPLVQEAIAVLAFIGGIYAGYDLFFQLSDWRRHPIRALARGWLCLVLTVIGIEQIAFETNALLQLSYVTGLPLNALQIAFIASIVAAALIW